MSIVTAESSVIKLRKLLISEDQINFRIPAIQRNYKWNSKKAQELIEAIIDFSHYRKEHPENTRAKSLGLITLYKKGGEYLVIDGQQRFITLHLIISLLNIDKSKMRELVFERDLDTKERKEFLENPICSAQNQSAQSIDIYRMNINRETMRNTLTEKRGNLSDEDIFEAILELSCLCNYIENAPQQEFLNINAHKTRFSICDRVRSNLISFSELYRDELDKNLELVSSVLKLEGDIAESLSYKQAVSKLYDDILELLYKEIEGHKVKTVFNNISGIYCTLISHTQLDPDDTKESKINILYEYKLPSHTNQNKTNSNYQIDFDFSDSSSYIEALEYLSYCYELIRQLDEEFECGEIPSARSIISMSYDRGFLAAAKSLIDERIKLYGANSSPTMLHEILGSMNKLNAVIHNIKEYFIGDINSANSFLEAYSHAEVSREISNISRKENWMLCLPYHEIRCAITGSGQYMINRFLAEISDIDDAQIDIPPLLNIRSDEHLEFNGNSLFGTEKVSAEDLFMHDIVIPVIQRDYCMGSTFTEGGNNFLTYLFKCLESGRDIDAGCIIVGVKSKEDSQIVYIFDGQQRTFTIYNTLKYLNPDFDSIYTFEGRKNKLSPYSASSVENLKKQLEIILKGKNDTKINIYNELLKRVKFTVKTVDEISSAEQFFIDINDGVQLEKYEIFKSVLFDKIMIKCAGLIEKAIEVIENKTLTALFKLANATFNDMNLAARCAEEAEMMLADHILRRRYYNNAKRAKWPSPFIVVSSENDVVESAAYLEKLSEEDYEFMLDFLLVIAKAADSIDKAKKPDYITEYTNQSKGSSNSAANYIIWNQIDEFKKDMLFIPSIPFEDDSLNPFTIYSLTRVCLFLFNLAKGSDVPKRINYLDQDFILNSMIDQNADTNDSILKQLEGELKVYFFRGYRNYPYFQIGTPSTTTTDHISMTNNTILLPPYYSGWGIIIKCVGASDIMTKYKGTGNHSAIFTLHVRDDMIIPCFSSKNYSEINLLSLNQNNEGVLNRVFYPGVIPANNIYCFRYKNSIGESYQYIPLTNRTNAYKVTFI